MCVLYKLPHLHCIFEAHPFEIVRLQSSSEGSVKEAKRSLSEGKVFVVKRYVSLGMGRCAAPLRSGLVILAASDKAPE